MTGSNRRDKIRGLFLAAIMVTSVFVGFIALSGTAAAAANASSAVQAVEYDADFQNGVSDDNGTEIDLVFNKSTTVTGVVVYVEEQEQTSAAGVLDDDGKDTVLVDAGDGDVTPNQNLTIVATVNNTGESQQTLKFSTDSDVDDAADVTVTSQNVPTADVSGDNATIPEENVFEGEVLALVDEEGAEGRDVEVSGPNGLELQGSAISDNSPVQTIDTEGLELGETYSVNFTDPSPEYAGEFQVADLGLTATADDANIDTDDDVEVDISAIRGNAPLSVELNETDDDDPISQQNDVSLGSDGEVTVTFDGSNNDDDPDEGAFTDDQDGDYVVNVVDNQTGVTVDTDTITVSEAGEGEADLGPIAPEQRGDIVGIPITMSDTDTATVRVGSDDVGYNATVNVTDENDDGVVGLGWNTYAAGTATDAFGTADDSDDEVVIQDVKTSTTGVNGYNDILAAGTYEVAVVAGDTAPPDESADNLGSVQLLERGDTSISLLTAPDDVDPADVDVDFVRENVGSAITPDSNIAENDHLIVQINAEGLEGVTNATGVDNARSQLIGIHSGGTADRNAGEANIDLSSPDDSTTSPSDTANATTFVSNQILIEAVEADPGPNQDAIVANAEGAIDGAAVDADNDTYYVVVDNDDGVLTDIDDSYNLEFTIPPYHEDDNSFGLVAPDGDFENETVSAEYTIIDEEATIDGPDTLGAPAQSGVTLTGTSNVAPGAELDVQVSTKNEQPSQFINTSTAVVQADGTWTADFGDTFADAVEGTEFEIEVSYENRDLDTDTDEGVVIGDPVTNALTFNDQQVVTEGTQVVTVAEVNLSQGGFIAIHQGGPGGPVIGNSDYIAEDTTRTNIAIALDEQLPQGETTLVAMSHQDTNNNEEYEFDGGAVDAPYPDDAFVSPATITAGQAQPTETDTPDTPDTPDEPTETDTPDEPDEPTETEPPADDTTTDGAGSPGFGVTAAIVALLGAALLALRRRA